MHELNIGGSGGVGLLVLGQVDAPLLQGGGEGRGVGAATGKGENGQGRVGDEHGWVEDPGQARGSRQNTTLCLSDAPRCGSGPLPAACGEALCRMLLPLPVR